MFSFALWHRVTCTFSPSASSTTNHCTEIFFHALLSILQRHLTLLPPLELFHMYTSRIILTSAWLRLGSTPHGRKMLSCHLQRAAKHSGSSGADELSLFCQQHWQTGNTLTLLACPISSNDTKHKMLIGSSIWGAPSFNSLLCIMPYAEDRRDEHQSKHHDMTSELVTKDFSDPLFPSTARATHCTLPLTYRVLANGMLMHSPFSMTNPPLCLSKTDAWTQQIQTTANITPEQQFTSAHLNFKQETYKPQRLLSVTLSGLLCYKQLNVTRFRVNSQKLLMTHTDGMIHTPTINSRNAQP